MIDRVKPKKGLKKNLIKYYLNEDNINLNKFKYESSDEDEISQDEVINKKRKKKIKKLFLNLNKL